MAQAFLKTEKNNRIPCRFNPAELDISKSNEWGETEPKGKNAPELTFQKGQSGKISLNLTFDTTDTGKPVTDHTDQLLWLMNIDESLAGSNHAKNNGRPPWCQFCWGSFQSFKAVVEALQLKFTYFSSDGTALRAQASLTLRQFSDEPWPPQNPTSGTPHPHSMHHVLPGETLDRIAAARYGDPTRWRVLAEANHVIDPLDLKPGTPLVVPEAEVRSRG